MKLQMTHLLPCPPDPVINNNFPECVSLKLHFEIKDQSNSNKFLSIFFPQKQTQRRIKLSLTILFGDEQMIAVPAGYALGLPEGKAKFGIRAGKLCISFHKCKILLETIHLGKSFDVFTDVEKTKERGKTSKSSFGLKNIFVDAERSGLDKVVNKSKIYHVTTSGFENAHFWKFGVRDNYSCLDGKLIKEFLGDIQVVHDSCTVNASFISDENSVILTGGQIGLTKDISRNKLALIERAIARRYIAPKLQPMSKVEWNYV